MVVPTSDQNPDTLSRSCQDVKRTPSDRGRFVLFQYKVIAMHEISV